MRIPFELRPDDRWYVLKYRRLPLPWRGARPRRGAEERDALANRGVV